MADRNRKGKPQPLWWNGCYTIMQMRLVGKYMHSYVNIELHKVNAETQALGNHSSDSNTGHIHIHIHKVSVIYKQYSICYIHKTKTKNNHITHMFLLLFLGGDIELNPVPKSIYPYGICVRNVNDSHRACCCDGCDTWCHKTFISMCTQDPEYLENRRISDICYKCNVSSLTLNQNK